MFPCLSFSSRTDDVSSAPAKPMIPSKLKCKKATQRETRVPWSFDHTVANRRLLKALSTQGCNLINVSGPITEQGTNRAKSW